MASRIMHLIIARKVAEEIEVDLNKFSLGNLAPDPHDLKLSSKKDAHYVIPGHIEYGGRYIDYDRFVEEHRGILSNDLYLGYLSHLISDDEWLRKIYVPVILDEANQIILEKQKHYYKDYGKLNRLLIEKYSLVNNYRHEAFPMERISDDRFKDHIEALSEDFSKVYKDNKLKVLDVDEVMDYIEATTDLVIDYIKKKQLR